MGLFSFIGKALKGVSKVAGFIPGIGGTVSKITGLVGGVLDSKKPMSTAETKARSFLARGGGRNPMVTRGKSAMSGGMWNASVLRSTPIMPGGAVSTPGGMKAADGGTPPMSFGGGGGTKRRTTKTKAARRRKKAKLKFGSPAWRKKYAPKGRRRRRAA